VQPFESLLFWKYRTIKGQEVKMTLLIKRHFRSNLKEKEKKSIRKELKKPEDKRTQEIKIINKL
jgi:hypothetical protein